MLARFGNWEVAMPEEPRRGRWKVRRWSGQTLLRAASLPVGGGWEFDKADGAHYGAGAVVCLERSGYWAVYDYRRAAEPVPSPVIIKPTAAEAMAAWDAYCMGVRKHERDV